MDPLNGQAWAAVVAHPDLLLGAADHRCGTQSPRSEKPCSPRSQATRVAPDDSTAYAVLAFALDWNANPGLVDDNQVQAYPDAGRPGGGSCPAAGRHQHVGAGLLRGDPGG